MQNNRKEGKAGSSQFSVSKETSTWRTNPLGDQIQQQNPMNIRLNCNCWGQGWDGLLSILLVYWASTEVSLPKAGVRGSLPAKLTLRGPGVASKAKQYHSCCLREWQYEEELWWKAAMRKGRGRGKDERKTKGKVSCCSSFPPCPMSLFWKVQLYSSF